MEREIPEVADKKLRNRQARRQEVLRWLGLLKYAFVLISVSSVILWLRIPIGNTMLWWLLDAFVLFVFWQLKPSFHKYRIPILSCWFTLVFANVIYSMTMAEYYWDWKFLFSNIFVFLMPLAAYVFAKPARLKYILRFWHDAIWIIFILLVAFMGSDGFGRLLMPFSFLALFFPILDRRLKLFVLLAALITLLFGADSRSNVLKFVVSLGLGFLIRFRLVMRFFRQGFHVIRILGFVAPIILLALAATGTFNIFEIGEGTTMVRASEEESGSLDDTRTMLYVEELTSALNHDYVWFGRSMARGYETVFFADDMETTFKGTPHHFAERYSCEVSILNIFNYFGVLGVVLYFLIFWLAAGKALFHSRNFYVRAIGLIVIFRWIFAWLEDFSRFDLNMLFLWIMIGICFSPKWRKMTNKQVRQWAQSL